jgi:hypothetical protein
MDTLAQRHAADVPLSLSPSTGATTYTPSHPLSGATNDSFRLQGVRHHGAHVPDTWLRTLDPGSVDWAPRRLAGLQRPHHLLHGNSGHHGLL